MGGTECNGGKQGGSQGGREAVREGGREERRENGCERLKAQRDGGSRDDCDEMGPIDRVAARLLWDGQAQPSQPRPPSAPGCRGFYCAPLSLPKLCPYKPHV